MTQLQKAPDRHPAFDGFDVYFEEKIASLVAPLETGRQKVARHYWLIIASALFFFTGAMWAAIAVFQSFALAFVGFMLAGAIVVFGLNWRMEGIHTQVSTALLGGIAEFLGLSHIDDATRPRSLETFRKRNLVPKNNMVECGDIVEGVWRGVKFACSEAWLSYRTRDNGGERTVFAGQLFRIDLPFTLPESVTLIARTEWFHSRRKPHVGAVNVTAEAEQLRPYYIVWGETQMASRVLAAHGLAPKLIKLARRYRNHKMRLCFLGDRVYIAVKNGDQLTPGSLFSPLDSQRRVRKAVVGFSHILRTVEAFAP